VATFCDKVLAARCVISWAVSEDVLDHFDLLATIGELAGSGAVLREEALGVQVTRRRRRVLYSVEIVRLEKPGLAVVYCAFPIHVGVWDRQLRAGSRLDGTCGAVSHILRPGVRHPICH